MLRLFLGAILTTGGIPDEVSRREIVVVSIQEATETEQREEVE